jgi:hypothetical protein
VCVSLDAWLSRPAFAVTVAAAVVLLLVVVAVLAIFSGQVHHSGYSPAH